MVAAPRLTPLRALALAAILAGIGGGYWLWSGDAPLVPQHSAQARAETEAWLAAIRARGRSGDWIAMRGYHAADHLVAGATLKPFSHAAILDLEHDRVIEAVSPRVRSVPLDEFVAGCHRLELIRPRSPTGQPGSSSEGVAALQRALEKLDEPYDFLGTIGMPSESKSYCSELVAWAWQIEVDRKGPHRVIHPAALSSFGEVMFAGGPRQREATPKGEVDVEEGSP